MRTCHYVVLGVEKNASETDIKKAYRRKALEWHPDKNHHRVEESTKQFALIAEAYEVLSDPQERAWYDSHRDAILRGDEKSDQPEGAAGTTSADLMKYFSSTIYKGFKDNADGFFAVYRNIFDKMAQEEEEAFSMANDTTSSRVSPPHFPSFGGSKTPYEADPEISMGDDVKQFYNAWLTFSTTKSFSWCDKFRLSEAPDRRVRRAMEKENKKFRDTARKEFNDTVLSLAAYVRKRDPRFMAYQEQQKQRQEQTKAETKARLEREKEALRARAEHFREQEWAKVQDDEDEDEDEDEYLEGEQDDQGAGGPEDSFYDQEFECVVCDKTFKSERQWKNHERSKRHLKAVEEIRLELMHEEDMLRLQGESDDQDDGDGDGNNNFDEADEYKDEDEDAELLEMAKATKGRQSASKADQEALSDNNVEGIEELEDYVAIDTASEEEIVAPVPTYSSLKSKKKNKKKNVMSTATGVEDFQSVDQDGVPDATQLDGMDQDELVDLLGSMRFNASANRSRTGTPSRNLRGSKKQQKKKGGFDDSNEDDGEGEDLGESEMGGTPALSTAPGSRAESPDAYSPEGAKGKKLSGKEKRKARLDAAAQKLAAGGGGGALKCRVCKADFESKNQLFNHIKETGHATITAMNSSPGIGSGSGVSPALSSKDDFYSSEDERGRGGKGKKGRGKRM